MPEWIVIVLIALGAGGIVWALMLGLQERETEKRLQTLTSGQAQDREPRGFLAGLLDRSRNDRRRKLEEALRQMQEQERKNKKRVTLRQRLQRAGLQTSEMQFYLFSLGVGLVLAALTFILSLTSLPPAYAMMAAGGAFVIGTVGIPFWLLRFLTNRRMNKFLHHLPDAVELMVRGLRSGLPVIDAMRTIADEVPDPVGPEFREVVEGQKIGLSLDQGMERMYERVPLPEVNFLAIVIAIQRETGGNLSEALSNLSNVLRARKTMKLKVKAITQEAKASAAIIGFLPVGLTVAISVLNPGYLDPIFQSTKGQFIAGFALAWMIAGVLVMRKMINFKF